MQDSQSQNLKEEKKIDKRKSRAGRGRKIITDEKYAALKELMRFRPTIRDCAQILDCHHLTIEKTIRERDGLLFDQFRELHQFPIKKALISQGLQMAFKGNTPLIIFMLKNYAGFSDSPDKPDEVVEDVNFID